MGVLMKKNILLVLSVFFPLVFSLSAFEKIPIYAFSLYPEWIDTHVGKEIEVEGFLIRLQEGVWILSATPTPLPCCKERYEKYSLLIDPVLVQSQEIKKQKLTFKGVLHKKEKANRPYFLSR
jgi:hypothetical protein